MNNRVVITGMGAITPVGNTVEDFWMSLCSGKNGVDKITKFDVSDFSTQIAACVKDFNPEDYMDKKRSQKNGQIYPFCCSSCQYGNGRCGAQHG